MEPRLRSTISYQQFSANREVYGKCSSWAVWNVGSCEHVRYLPSPQLDPKAFINRSVIRLNVISSQEELDKLGWNLRNDVVLVALNFAERPETRFEATRELTHAAFHVETTTTSDQRRRDACFGTPLWGAFITDLVKFRDGELMPLRASAASEVKPLLRNHSFLAEQVEGLALVLEQLGSNSR